MAVATQRLIVHRWRDTDLPALFAIDGSMEARRRLSVGLRGPTLWALELPHHVSAGLP